MKENFKASNSVSKKSAEYIKGVAVLLSGEPFVEKLKAFKLGKREIKELSENFGEAIGHPQKNKIEKLLKEFQDREKKEGGLPEPLLTGEDLLNEGWTAGPQLGELLKKAFAYQIEKKISEKKESIKLFKKRNIIILFIFLSGF